MNRTLQQAKTFQTWQFFKKRAQGIKGCAIDIDVTLSIKKLLIFICSPLVVHYKFTLGRRSFGPIVEEKNYLYLIYIYFTLNIFTLFSSCIFWLCNTSQQLDSFFSSAVLFNFGLVEVLLFGSHGDGIRYASNSWLPLFYFRISVCEFLEAEM